MSKKPLTAIRSSSILALCASTNHTTAALLEPVAGVHRLIAWESSQPPHSSPPSLPVALGNASRILGERLGRALWDEQENLPRLSGPDPALGLTLDQVVAAVDPLPPLRVWIGGLTGQASLAAAQLALESTICVTIAVHRFSTGGSPTQLAAELNDARPDLAVVVGGYDRPALSARRATLALCDEIAQALSAMPSGNRPALYFAGNRWAASQALDMWAHVPGGIDADAVENIAPGPGVQQTTSLAVAASRLYWRRCRATPAARTLSRWITPPTEVRSVSWAFAQAVRLWRQVHNLTSLHGLFCAGPLWIHACAIDGEEGVRLRFVRPHTRPVGLTGWPPLRLVSGPWPERLWARPQGYWWDPAGLTPAVANVGQIDPLIAYQVLSEDLLKEG